MTSYKMPARLGHGVNVLRGKVTVTILDFCFTKLETIGGLIKVKNWVSKEDPLHFTSCIMLMQIMMNSINWILIK